MIDTFGIDSMTIDVSGDVFVSLTEKVSGINYVFKWTGTSWIEVGGPTSENRLIGNYISRIRYKNGILYAGVNTPPALGNSVFRFISNTWNPIGDFTLPVYEFDVDSSNNVYVATGNSIRKYTGVDWINISPEVGFFNNLVVDQSDRVYTAKLNAGVDGFRVYDDGLWATLPNAPMESDDVVKMCTYNNKLFVAGWSVTTDEMIVAVYDGSDWTQLDEIVTTFPSVAGYEISALYADDKGVYITYKGAYPSSVIKWNGLQWLSIGDNLLSSNGVGGAGYLTSFIRNADGYLMGAGYIENIDGSVAGNVARYLTLEDAMLLPPPIWTGLPFIDGNTNPIKAATTDGTNLYVAIQNWYGTSSSPTPDGIFVYKFDGVSWTEVGGPGNRITATSRPTMDPISCMEWNNGKLYLGTYGDNVFKFESGVWSNLNNYIDYRPGNVQTMSFDALDPDVIYVASESLYRWTGTAWEEYVGNFNSIFPNFYIGSAYISIVLDNGNLIVAGYLEDEFNQLSRDGYCKFDGITWSGIGNENSPIPEFRKVRAMTSYLNHIYVLGKDQYDRVAVAKFDGKEWKILGDIYSTFPEVADATYVNNGANSFTDNVSLEVDETGVYISAFGNGVGRTLQWNGIHWLDIGSPMVNNSGKVFRFIDPLNTAGIFGDIVKIGSRLYGTGTLTEIDGQTAGNIAYREITSTYFTKNWYGINLEPIFYNSGYDCFVLDNDEAIIAVSNQTIFSPPYDTRIFRYKDFRFNNYGAWLTPTWEEIGGVGNRPNVNNVKDIVIKNGIIYIQGSTIPSLYKYEGGVWSALPAAPIGLFHMTDTLEVDSQGQVIASTYENLWRLESGVWVNLLNEPGYWINARVTSTDTIYAHLRENAGPTIELRYYDGVGWNTLVNPPNVDFSDAVTDSTKFFIYDDDLYITGFNTINSIYNVYKWNGVGWTQIGDISVDLPDIAGWENLSALYVDDKGIYLNAILNDIGGGSFVIKWNGSNWIKIADLVGSDVETFGSIRNFDRKSNGRLMAAGFLSHVEGVPAKGISRFDVDEVIVIPPKVVIDISLTSENVEQSQLTIVSGTLIENKKEITIIEGMNSSFVVENDTGVTENVTSVLYPISVVESSDSNNVDNIETIDTYELSSTMYSPETILEGANSAFTAEEAANRAFGEFAQSGVVSVESGTLVGSGFQSTNIGTESANSGQVSLTAGTLNPIVIHQTTIGPEKIDSGQMVITAGSLQNILVQLTGQDSHKINSSFTLTTGSLT